jgi:hypothetical protein
VRGRVLKSVGRPADIYSLGAVFYYLISGAYANPKTLYDAFHKFIEYEKRDENNSIEAYIDHEYRTSINSLRAPKKGQGAPEVAPADRFFSYKHYLDGNGELIDPTIMLIIAKAMIRNKPDSYCQAWDVRTTGIAHRRLQAQAAPQAPPAQEPLIPGDSGVTLPFASCGSCLGFSGIPRNFMSSARLGSAIRGRRRARIADSTQSCAVCLEFACENSGLPNGE